MREHFCLDVGNLTADYPSYTAQSSPAYAVLSLGGAGGLGPLMRHSQVSARACGRVAEFPARGSPERATHDVASPRAVMPERKEVWEV